MSQVVPLPTKKSIPVVSEYQSALAATGSKAGTSFNGLEGFITAKVFVEGLKKTGKDVTRQKFIKAVEGITELDLGGYFVGFSPTKHNGSSYVDITVINKDGRFFN
jgi:ABC-type branched-subunit amino acid transport system substrate-binding protein